jgi:glycosyltransferase involved in cell wall biosynthesis
MAYLPTWKHRLRVWVGSGASAIVSNSSGGDEYWKTQLPHSRRYVVRNGLPVHDIDRTLATVPAGFTKCEAPIVLYVGRLTSGGSAIKNLKPFLEALKCVRQELEVLGILCGDGPQRSELKALRHRLGLDADVHFTGHLPVASVWALMKKASVFVSLSGFEGCPNAVIEAMACGTPVVTSNVSSLPEVAGNAALMVDPYSLDAICDALERLLTNRRLHHDLMQLGLVQSRRFTWESSAAQLRKIYESVL